LLKLQEISGQIQKDGDNKINAQKTIKIKELVDILNKELADLKPSEQIIQATKAQLSQERTNLDKIIQLHEAQWQQHREVYFNQLEEQLKKHGLILTDTERNELRQGSNNTSSIEQKLAQLKKIGITVENQDSDFSIIAYDAIVAVLSRELKKVDNKTVNNIIEQLPVIIEEKKIANNIRTDHVKQYEQIIVNIHNLKTKEVKIEQDLDENDEVLSSVDQKMRLISGKK
jgi:hypothetical protein